MNVRLNLRAFAIAAPVAATAFVATPALAHTKSAPAIRATTATLLVPAQHHHGYRVLTVRGGRLGTLVIVNRKNGATSTQVYTGHHHKLFAGNVPESVRQANPRVAKLKEKGGLHFSQALHREVFAYAPSAHPANSSAELRGTLPLSAPLSAGTPQTSASQTVPAAQSIEAAQPAVSPSNPAQLAAPSIPLSAPATALAAPQMPQAVTSTDRIQPALTPSENSRPWQLLMAAVAVAALGAAIRFATSVAIRGVKRTRNRSKIARNIAVHKALTEATLAAASPNPAPASPAAQVAVHDRALPAFGAWLKAKTWQPALAALADIRKQAAMPFQREAGALYPVPALPNRMATGLHRRSTAFKGVSAAGVILVSSDAAQSALHTPALFSPPVLIALPSPDNVVDWHAYSQRRQAAAPFDLKLVAGLNDRSKARSLPEILKDATAAAAQDDALLAAQREFQTLAAKLATPAMQAKLTAKMRAAARPAVEPVAIPAADQLQQALDLLTAELTETLAKDFSPAPSEAARPAGAARAPVFAALRAR